MIQAASTLSLILLSTVITPATAPEYHRPALYCPAVGYGDYLGFGTLVRGIPGCQKSVFVRKYYPNSQSSSTYTVIASGKAMSFYTFTSVLQYTVDGVDWLKVNVYP